MLWYGIEFRIEVRSQSLDVFQLLIAIWNTSDIILQIEDIPSGNTFQITAFGTYHCDSIPRQLSKLSTSLWRIGIDRNRTEQTQILCPLDRHFVSL